MILALLESVTWKVSPALLVFVGSFIVVRVAELPKLFTSLLHRKQPVRKSSKPEYLPKTPYLLRFLRTLVSLFLNRYAPMLTGHFPALLPTLRPYQRRAAAWMVARERGPYSTSLEGASSSESVHRHHPLWSRVEALDGGEAFWYNPFVGRLSRKGFPSAEYVRGGILAGGFFCFRARI